MPGRLKSCHSVEGVVSKVPSYFIDSACIITCLVHTSCDRGCRVQALFYSFFYHIPIPGLGKAVAASSDPWLLVAAIRIRSLQSVARWKSQCAVVCAACSVREEQFNFRNRSVLL
jgi:hypothetical protein